MSDQSHHQAPDHTPHVQPLKVYLATWGALVVLTAITVGASYVNFGPANLVIAIVIATIKAAVVAALFMHLLHDHKFHALVLVSGALFLIIFIAFTMFDTEYRGRADAVEGERPMDITRPFEGTKSLAAVSKKWGGAHAATSAAAHPPGATTAAASAAHESPPVPSVSAAPAPEVAPSSSVSASVTPPPSSSLPPPPSASIAPAPSGQKAPEGKAH